MTTRVRHFESGVTITPEPAGEGGKPDKEAGSQREEVERAIKKIQWRKLRVAAEGFDD